VLIDTRDQFPAALALIELDGIARRLIIGTPDLPPDHLATLVAKGGVDAIVSDHEGDVDGGGGSLRVLCTGNMTAAKAPPACCKTEWVLLTSGTSGAPKMVVHSFESLTGAIGSDLTVDDVVWGTFYDIRRYGGLQILLRAVLGTGSFVLSEAGESIGDYLLRLAVNGATHISGTPSHWRRVLMSPNCRGITPRYIRLSGELADQGILNALHSFYSASVSHAYASTEAGVAFEVSDGLQGFPAAIVDAPGDVHVKVDDAGSLRIRSPRNAACYLGEDNCRLIDEDGFVDTGDMVERRGDRYYFLGRRNGIINVGGLKVYPEEVEAAINRHPSVRMSRVRPKRSSITGSLIAADVVLKADWAAISDAADFRREILQICRANLAPHKVPATIHFVPALEIAAAGKLARHA
jgi:acyl-coenzyme A synthetase/AMP-(fatty) acid ligase